MYPCTCLGAMASRGEGRRHGVTVGGGKGGGRESDNKSMIQCTDLRPSLSSTHETPLLVPRPLMNFSGSHCSYVSHADKRQTKTLHITSYHYTILRLSETLSSPTPVAHWGTETTLLMWDICMILEKRSTTAVCHIRDNTISEKSAATT